MTRTRLNDQFLAIIRDPVRFARVLLGQDLWDTQEAILRSVAANPRTAVKACHASSKTFTAAAAVLWWITSHPDGIAITTAPTWHQVERVLWPEIHRAAREAKIGYPQPLQTELRLGPTCYAAGLATDEGVRFQGFHGDILIVIDEAPGVRPDIWEAIEGIRAGGNVHVLALGNPTIANSPFADAFTVDADRWSTLTISAFDTPNLRGLTPQALLALPEDDLDRNERPYLVTRNWVKEKWLEWGQHGSPLWQARVLGQFPDQAEDALFSLAWLEAAKQRDAHDDRKGLPVEIGIDVAGPGEAETAVAVRQGPNLLALRTWQASDSRPPVLAFLAPWRERIATVRVDSVGMGHYFAASLRDTTLPVEAVNVATAATRPERFANRKAELYWGLRERAEAGDLAGLVDDEALSQLASIRYEHNSRGQVVIESKEAMRKRGLKSPDRAEAVMLAFAGRGRARFHAPETDRVPEWSRPVLFGAFGKQF